ncbi:11037_t:CDS:2, partial [Cetraspora pellucida]
TSKSDSSKLPPEKRPRRPRVSGIAYMEAQPPPTLYMPDDDDETVIKEVMLLMDKIGNEPKSYNYAGGAVHNGYCCDGCHMDPILGTRFLCMNCDETREVDLCEDCMIEGKFENEHHKKSHRFSAIVNPTSQRFNADYVPEQVDEY